MKMKKAVFAQYLTLTARHVSKLQEIIMSSTWDDPIFATSEPIKKEEKVEITETLSSSQESIQQEDTGQYLLVE